MFNSNRNHSCSTLGVFVVADAVVVAVVALMTLVSIRRPVSTALSRVKSSQA